MNIELKIVAPQWDKKDAENYLNYILNDLMHSNMTTGDNAILDTFIVDGEDFIYRQGEEDEDA